MRYLLSVTLPYDGSLLEFSNSHWGMKVICNAMRLIHIDVDLFCEVRQRSLEKKLEDCLRLAVKLDEDDESIFDIYKMRLSYSNLSNQ